MVQIDHFDTFLEKKDGRSSLLCTGLTDPVVMPFLRPAFVFCQCVRRSCMCHGSIEFEHSACRKIVTAGGLMKLNWMKNEQKAEKSEGRPLPRPKFDIP